MSLAPAGFADTAADMIGDRLRRRHDELTGEPAVDRADVHPERVEMWRQIADEAVIAVAETHALALPRRGVDAPETLRRIVEASGGPS